MKIKLIRLSLLLLIIPYVSNSQASRKRWKAYRIEFDLGVGASNFLGELGGANQVGTHAFRDLELNQSRLAFSGGIRYRLAQWFALHPRITYGKVAGDDKLTTEFFRNYRNLNFKSNILELAMTGEVSFIKEQVGRRYRLRGVRGIRNIEISAYGFAGVGAFYFNPKGEYNGKFYALQPLGTEGQGAIETRKKYKRIQICVPLGLGFKYAIDRNWSIGLELGLRHTFTDYIDDVSKTYVDPSLLLRENGQLSPLLADKSRPEEYIPDYTYITEAGQQRGDPRHNDSYMFAIFSLNYRLKTGRVNYPMF